MSVRRASVAPLVLACGLALIAPGSARGHFLFAYVGPLAEGGRHAELFFSAEADAGEPKYVEKMATAKLWLQDAPGAFRPLELTKGVDRLRALVPPTGSVSVVGVWEWGVIARPKQTPFLLRYYPRAVAGDPDELNRLERCKEVPLEVAATFREDRVELVALHDGKPAPKATFMIVHSDLTEDKVEAGEDGKAVWTPAEPGRYSIYTRRDTKTRGEVNGASYEEVREFATLALDWPLDRGEPQPEAVALFEGALAARAQWRDFPGFTADAQGEFDGRPFAGKVEVKADGSVKVEVDDEAGAAWVEDQLASLAMHRFAPPAGTDPPALRLADDRADHPLGRLLTVEGGRFAASYRVKGDEITSVNRHLGPKVLTITTLDNDRNAEGKVLPRSYLVQYWEAATGRLDRAETVRDRWARVGAFDLPAEHVVTVASGGTFAARSLTLTGHALAAPGR